MVWYPFYDLWPAKEVSHNLTARKHAQANISHNCSYKNSATGQLWHKRWNALPEIESGRPPSVRFVGDACFCRWWASCEFRRVESWSACFHCTRLRTETEDTCIPLSQLSHSQAASTADNTALSSVKQQLVNTDSLNLLWVRSLSPLDLIR